MNKFLIQAVSLCLLAITASGMSPPLLAQPDSLPEEVESELSLTAAEREARGIVTERVTNRNLSDTLTVPGEVRMNAYASAQVTPRLSGQVIARHKRLGEQVEQGEAMVTLSSVMMAEAQGALIEADREWNRVSLLGRAVVSEARMVAAEVARQRAYATVRAYGLTDEQVDALLAGGDISQATGMFDLLSPQTGTVTRDDFVLGEVVDAGRVLFEVSDESTLWVEAQLGPEQADEVTTGSPARVSRDGQQWLEGEVIQLQHRLNEVTRTRGVRIAVSNQSDTLHPGEFVDVELRSTAGEAIIAVPTDAVLLLQGSTVVFKLEDGNLRPQQVSTGAATDGWSAILTGLTEGDEIVTQNAFLLKSLLLKSQLGEGD